MVEAEKNNICFSEDEKEILQEVMNISFGKVAAELAEIINVMVVLSVPKVTILPGSEFSDYISRKLHLSPPYNIIQQSFSGKLNGLAFLVFPGASGKKLAVMFEKGEASNFDNNNKMTRLEKETLIEIGNILTGACVGKLVTHLKESAYFTLPRLIMASSYWEMPPNLIDPESVVILVKTEFGFETNDVKGYLFIITNQDSFSWLKHALNDYLKQF
ncbi:MAG: chemotaxis protein CheC [Nitrospiria bacterium]